jgi:hypothetical protein
MGLGVSLNGNKNKNDGVAWVSTLAEYSTWWDAGRPLQGYTDQLGVLDVPASGAPHPSRTPQGKSILDRWPAGTKISLVFYVSDGFDKAMPQIPTVKVGPDGRALTSWMTSQTVASTTNGARTSGGYKVLTGAGTGPGVAAEPKDAATAGQPSGAPSSGSSPGAPSTNVASATGKASSTADDGGFIESMPGGAPTFWIVLILIVVGVAGGATLRLRSASADR